MTTPMSDGIANIRRLPIMVSMEALSFCLAIGS
jgi:hypothetical protein